MNLGGCIVLFGIFLAFCGFNIDYDEKEKREVLKLDELVGRFFKWCNK
jgi:hypothetical protein